MGVRGTLIRASNGDLELNYQVSDVVHLDTSREQRNGDIIVALLESWVCLLADSPLNVGARSQKPRRVFRRFARDFLKGPLKDYALSLSALADTIVSSTTLYGTGSLTGDWVPEMQNTPIFREYQLWYQSGDPKLLTFILSFLYFGKKLSYEDSELNSTAFREWEEVELKLSDLQLDEQMTAAMALITSTLIPSIELAPVLPKFGPGRVAERGVFGVIAKANAIAFDAKLDRLFFRGHFALYGAMEELGFQIDEVLPDPSKWNAASGCVERVSRLKFVEKDMGKSRSICMEPNSYMYFQQAVEDACISTMRKTIARRFINLRDQSRNRDLARYGSWSGEVDTIDLSSASDSVSVELVRQIFPRKVLYYLLGTRTPRVRVLDGTVRDVKKFAPMGSALCFPVQCVVFTTVVIYAAMMRAHGCADGELLPLDSPWLQDIEGSVDKLFRREPSPYYGTRASFEPAAVYGDDICVDSKLTQIVTHLLTRLGFKVNTKKSFTGSCAFRESCGGYYHDGEDVTPLRFRVKRYWGKIGPESVASMISGANRAGDYHYLNFRRWLVQRLLFGQLQGVRQFHGRNPIAFLNNKNQGTWIYSTNPQNSHLFRRHNRDYQKDELRCIIISRESVIEATDVESDAVERYLHLRWWGSRFEGGISGELQDFPASRIDTSGTRLSLKWIQD